jgi:hypothetical protein
MKAGRPMALQHRRGNEPNPPNRPNGSWAKLNIDGEPHHVRDRMRSQSLHLASRMLCIEGKRVVAPDHLATSNAEKIVDPARPD